MRWSDDYMNTCFMIIGVTGSGKSTFAHHLAKKLSLPMVEAEHLLDDALLKRLRAGEQLTEQQMDRWHKKIAESMAELQHGGAVLVYAGLREADRRSVLDRLESVPVLIYLQGDYDTLATQIRERDGSGSSLSLLKRQFDDLEEPEDALYIPLSDDLNFVDEADAVIEQQKLRS
jgi:gluconokinase